VFVVCVVPVPGEVALAESGEAPVGEKQLMAEASQEEIQAAEELLRRFSLDVLGQEAELRAADHAAGLVHIFADRTREEGVRLKAYELLVRTETEPYKKVILAALSEPSERIRATAVHGLPKVLSEDRLVEQYLALLKDRSGWVRYNAAEALQRHPTKEAVGPLLDLLADESIETRHRAIGTLLFYKFPEIRPRLRALAQAADPTVAGAASCGLAYLQGEDVHMPNLHRYLQQELEKLTGPPYYGVDEVVHVIRVLGEKKSPTSIPVLREAARHPHRFVREEADKAIETILRPAMAWGPAVQGLQCGIQREKAQVDVGGSLPVTLSVRNASPRQTVRLLKLESQKGFWGEALPLIVEFREPDGQWTPATYRGPVLTPPPPPIRRDFIDLGPRQTDSVRVAMNLAHWGITMPGEVRVAFYQENRRDKTEAGDGPVEGLWVGRAVSGTVSVEVLPAQPEAAREAAGPGLWTPWTAPIKGMQFRMRSLLPGLDEESLLPLEIEIRNVGKEERYILDPGKIDDAHASIYFEPFVLLDGERRRGSGWELIPIMKPEWYALLKPGQSVTGERKILCPFPKGRYDVYFRAPRGGGLKGTIEEKKWSRGDIERISTKLWQSDDREAAIGPIRVVQEHGERNRFLPVPTGAPLSDEAKGATRAQTTK